MVNQLAFLCHRNLSAANKCLYRMYCCAARTYFNSPNRCMHSPPAVCFGTLSKTRNVHRPSLPEPPNQTMCACIRTMKPSLKNTVQED